MDKKLENIKSEEMSQNVKSSDVILQTISKVVIFIILSFSIFLFLSGHNAPGGGFIGGLMTASAMILLFMAYDIETIRWVIPIRFHHLIAVGLFFALGTGLGGLFFGVPFLTHTFGHLSLPFLGEIELATALLFDTGVYLTVVGVSMSIMLSIGVDR